jgi:NitT/TauT family transport system substrate-binding protein
VTAAFSAVLTVAMACGGETVAPSPTNIASATPTPATVTIGQVGGISDAAIYIAQAKGYFAQQGIVLDSTSFASAANMVAPLLRGDLLVGGGATGAGILNAIQTGGAGIRIVADKGTLTPGHGYEGILVRAAVAEQIKGPRDLKGRSVALSARDITPEVTLDTYLRSGGLTIKDVNVVVIPHAQMQLGFETGAVDAGLPIEPYLTAILETGKAKLLTRSDAVVPGEQTAVLFFSERLVKQRELGVRFVVAYLKGARFYNDAFDKKEEAKRGEAIDILAKATQFDRRLIEKLVMPGIDPNGRVNVESLKELQNYLLAKGTMSAPVDMSVVVEPTFASDAVAVLGPYR